jgi:hypothetical protein
MLELTVDTRVRVAVENNKWAIGTVKAVEDTYWAIETDMQLATGGMGEPNTLMYILKDNEDKVKLLTDSYFENMSPEFLLG